MHDPKPPRRVRNLELLRELHTRWRGECVLEGDECVERFNERFSLHHIHKHPRDDLEANLVMLCGDGTSGHHGLVEAHDRYVCSELGMYLFTYRMDTMLYLREKLGSVEAAREWLRSQLYAPV